MSDESGTSEDGEDRVYSESHRIESKRYPVHDCCEFEDAESLRRLIFIPQDLDSENEEDSDEGKLVGGDNDSSSGSGSSSSDENDSAAAAHAAAIGHSPQPLPTKVLVRSDVSEAKVMEKEDGTPSDTEQVEATGGMLTNHSTPNPLDLLKFGASRNGAASNASPVIIGASYKSEVEHQDPSNAMIHCSSGRPGEVPNGGIEKVTGLKAASKAKRRASKFHCPYNLNERDNDENTPIHIAIHARKIEHVKLLLEAGASVHKKSDGSPPVHAAISIGSVARHAQFAYECVVVLCKGGADLTAKDDALHTPLYLACMFNLPQIVNYIFSTAAGLSTLNMKADRSGGRALHAAARFDSSSTFKAARGGSISAGHARLLPGHHHPDGTVASAMHHIPGFSGKLDHGNADGSHASPPSAGSPALLTQVLLGTKGIEIDATNSVGQTPLHVACLRGNWSVARLLLQAGANAEVADRRGFTPGQQAHRRGMPIPNDLLDILGGPPSSGTVAPPRDLIVDPDSTTLLLSHELCSLHRSCPPIRRDSHTEPPPENVRRLTVLVDEQTGILRSEEFNRCAWENETRRAAIVDVLKCHDYNYVETISQLCSSIPDHPSAVAHLDADTTLSRWSFEAALRAAGSVCEAVDKVVSGDYRNAFCAVRPPGHHAGPRGIVRCANDPDGGSHGFCLLNNVAIGAAYARSMYRNEGIRKIAIIDFDVHHGNGTEEIIRHLIPNAEKAVVRTPFVMGELSASRYRPWLDETDIHDVFFASTHGYGPRGLEFAEAPQGGWFYPASGKSYTSDAIKNPALVESPNLTDFLLSQTWTRMGDESRSNCCKILNCGLGLPGRETVPGMQRLELRDTYRQRILPCLREFDPDIIFISAGFDAHKKDSMNFGYVGMVEDDYEWVTEQLVRIANTCCNGRIVSVLEGGYKIHGGIVSPFARSVASHVRALVDGGLSRELYDSQDGEWESQFERHLVDERERKRQQKLEKLRMITSQSRQGPYDTHTDTIEEGLNDCLGSRKRKRAQVDYRELYEQMKLEGFVG